MPSDEVIGVDLGDGAEEEHRLLPHHAELPAQPLEVEALDVHAWWVNAEHPQLLSRPEASS